MLWTDHFTWDVTGAHIIGLTALGRVTVIALRMNHEVIIDARQIQQWDGRQWTVISDWIAPDQALVRPLVEASAARYAQEKGITPRTCP